MDHRQVVRMLAAGRVVVGGALVVAPGLAGAQWMGPAARQNEVKLMTRAMGVRDLALGVGTLRALETGEPVRTWVQLGGISDAVDVIATALAVRHIGLRRAVPAMTVAALAATLSAWAAEHLE